MRECPLDVYLGSYVRNYNCGFSNMTKRSQGTVRKTTVLGCMSSLLVIIIIIIITNSDDIQPSTLITSQSPSGLLLNIKGQKYV